jgi:hypothetical protein
MLSEKWNQWLPRQPLHPNINSVANLCFPCSLPPTADRGLPCPAAVTVLFNLNMCLLYCFRMFFLLSIPFPPVWVQLMDFPPPECGNKMHYDLFSSTHVKSWCLASPGLVWPWNWRNVKQEDSKLGSLVNSQILFLKILTLRFYSTPFLSFHTNYLPDKNKAY